jgi:hypothetical protein
MRYLNVAHRIPWAPHLKIKAMKEPAIFAERYRVIAVDALSLVLKGVRSGEVVTITNADPTTPFTPKDYPPGKLIAISDPAKGAAPGSES